MHETEDTRDLERKIEQASRVARNVTDRTTYDRLMAWVEELQERLQRRFSAAPSQEDIGRRAHDLWVAHGRPTGRDEEFWLRAESELKGKAPTVY